jgi:hypothetical protein
LQDAHVDVLHARAIIRKEQHRAPAGLDERRREFVAGAVDLTAEILGIESACDGVKARLVYVGAIAARAASRADEQQSTLTCWRSATQMSMPCSAASRLVAKNKVCPSGDSMGQPSSALVFTLCKPPESMLVAGSHGPNGWAVADDANSSVAAAVSTQAKVARPRPACTRIGGITTGRILMCRVYIVGAPLSIAGPSTARRSSSSDGRMGTAAG